MASGTSGEQIPLGVALRSTARFAWDELPTIVIVSVCWLLASLPLLTIGPATLGAYTAVLAKRAAHRGEIPDTPDALTGFVLGRVRRGAVPATAVGVVPLLFGAITAVYAVQFLVTGTVLFGALALASLVVGSQICLVVLPGLLYLAEGRESHAAIRAGYTWSISNPRRSVGTGVLTVVIGALLLSLTVAFPLLFGGFVAVFHAEAVLPTWRFRDDSADGPPGADVEWTTARESDR